MTKPSKRPDPLISELLKRARATGLTDVQIQERAELKGGVMSQMKRGVYGPDAESVKKLRRWIERFEVNGREPARPEPSVVATIAACVAAPEGVEPLGEAASKIVAKLEAAEAPEDFLDAFRWVAIGAARGIFAPKVAKLMLDAGKQAMAAVRAGGRKVDVLAQATDVLTPQERKLVDDDRRSKAVPPLKPGETPPPPPAEDAAPPVKT